MRRHSSIFSFDTLYLPRRVPRAWGAAAVVLLGVEIGVYRQDWFWALVPASHVGVFFQVEQQLRRPGRSPSILLCGSSLMRDAGMPRELERCLSLEPGTTVNLGVTAGRPADVLWLWRRNSQVFDHARLIVLETSPWQFNGGMELGPRFRCFGSLRQRLESRNADLIAGWFLRMSDGREYARKYLQLVEKGRLNRRPAQWDSSGRMFFRAVQQTEPPATSNFRNSADLFYGNWSLSALHCTDFRQLCARAKQAGVLLRVIELPKHRQYVEYVDHHYRRQREEYERWLQQVLDGQVVYRFTHVSATGNDRVDDFRDYGHLSSAGARRFTGQFAAWLAEQLGEPTETAQQRGSLPGD